MTEPGDGNDKSDSLPDDFDSDPEGPDGRDCPGLDPGRPDVTTAIEDGDLYVYAEEDLEDIAAEVFAQVRHLEGVDDAQASEIADMIYDLHTGDWLHTDE